MFIENDKSQGEYTFRKWNPSKERVMWGSDNNSSVEPIMPMFLIGWYLVEIMFFRAVFNETVDHCGHGRKPVIDILRDYSNNYNISGCTNIFRVITWLLNVGACFMLFYPILFKLAWIPFVGQLIHDYFHLSALIFGLYCATMLQILAISLTWIKYRTFVAIIMLLMAISMGTLMIFFGKAMSRDEAASIYASNGYM